MGKFGSKYQMNVRIYSFKCLTQIQTIEFRAKAFFCILGLLETLKILIWIVKV